MTEAEELNAIFAEVVALPASNPRVVRYIRLGIGAELKQRQKKYRRLAKEGRADEIPDENIRAYELEWQQASQEYEMRSYGELGSKVSVIIDDFKKKIEDTILGKWMVNGIPLGQTTPEQLRSAAADEYERAEGHTKNGNFYLKIADAGQSRMPIMMSLTPEKVEDIRSDIFDNPEMASAA